jgi:hypothetical protein
LATGFLKMATLKILANVVEENEEAMKSERK